MSAAIQRWFNRSGNFVHHAVISRRIVFIANTVAAKALFRAVAADASQDAVAAADGADLVVEFTGTVSDDTGRRFACIGCLGHHHQYGATLIWQVTKRCASELGSPRR